MILFVLEILLWVVQGKSPIVQAITKEFLKKNYIVAIASRGMGKNIKPIYVNSFDPSGIEFLSDENREHFELFKPIFYRIKFIIFYKIHVDKNL